MTTHTLTLAEFVTARLDEDKAAALAASPGPWEPFSGAEMGGGEYITTHRGPEGYAFGISPGWVGNRGFEIAADDATHIARHDPARILAQCTALRAVLALHVDAGESQGDRDDGYGVIDHCCTSCGTFGEYGQPWPCPTLHQVATIWRDHEAFNPEWAS